MSTGQGALRARYRDLLNDLLLTAVMRRYCIFNGHFAVSLLPPWIAIHLINHGAREDAVILLALVLGSWLCAGCAWLLFGRAARPELIEAAYRKVGTSLAPSLRKRLAALLRGEHPNPISIREVAEATRGLIATEGPRATSKAALRADRVAKQRAAINEKAGG